MGSVEHKQFVHQSISRQYNLIFLRGYSVRLPRHSENESLLQGTTAIRTAALSQDLQRVPGDIVARLAKATTNGNLVDVKPAIGCQGKFLKSTRWGFRQVYY
jgi:hypothetical protein